MAWVWHIAIRAVILVYCRRTNYFVLQLTDQIRVKGYFVLPD